MIQRCDKNPVITPEMVKPSNPRYRVRGTFNPGAVMYKDEILLLVRVAEDVPAEQGMAAVPVVEIKNGKGAAQVLEVRTDDPEVFLKDTRGIVYKGKDYLSTMSHIRLARSKDGVNFKVEHEPFIFPSAENEIYGVEDARVIAMEGIYYINYTCVSSDGWATMLAKTNDFKKIERLGIIFHPENKDVCIFPEKTGNKYHALHRPNNSGFGKPSIWYASSPDMMHWGEHRCLVRPRDIFWEEQKIGAGAPSLFTEEGWLQIYHGKGHDQIYSLFALLLDKDDPAKIIARGQQPLIKPELPYETQGFFPNVIFTNGMVMKDGRLLIYYGASDEFVCLAETTVEEVLATLKRKTNI